MFVVLGFCTAGLIGLAILPAFYRRAARLTEEALRAVNPSSYAEVRAAQDQERARYAVELRRVETRLDKEREKAAKFHLEASQLRSEAEALKKEHESQLAELHAKLAAQSSDQHAVDMLSAEIKTLKEKLSESEKALAASWTKSDEAPSSRDEVSAASEADDERDWLPATDTMALATITGLEAEVATLKAKLARYEPTVASEVEATLKDASKSRLAELEAQLVDTESKYVAAQAEATRLSLLLEAAGSAAAKPDKHLEERLKQLSGEIARQQSALQEKERVQKRLVGQVQKLRADLEVTPELKDLRRDFRALSQRLSAASSITVTPVTASPPPQELSPQRSGQAATQQKTEASAQKVNGARPVATPSPEQRPESQVPVAEFQDPGQATPQSPAQTSAKSADIASAAEALVSRIVASSRNKSKSAVDSDAAPAAAPSKPDTGTPKKSKSAKQKKRDVA
ncbi:hypothetical protein [Roseibium sediminicola]|uniref:Uncharacterized protein n=1 Tax=Roseibium sediminicola TaxID=2933272 RepID=A0ABT0GVF5_9HYPH|nr:hypothetical protein [Roseibium sp. CAU 1639]MCK7613200.1 hypothetical protein [Roseibium sp. CAU 1639]